MLQLVGKALRLLSVFQNTTPVAVALFDDTPVFRELWLRRSPLDLTRRLIEVD